MKIFDYECKTTFWDDFSLADTSGKKAVIGTYRRVFDEWKSNAVYLTELVMVLNHKIWQHYEDNNDTLARLYDELWREADAYAVDHLTGADLRYYLQTID